MQRLTREPAIQRRSYRPEQRSCPSCQSTLTRSHILWRKRLISLSGPVHVTSWGYHCSDAVCATAAVVYRSAAAEGLHLRKPQFGREVIVQVGYRRFWYHQTIYEIHAWLTEDLELLVSARQVANLVADFLALLQAAQPAKIRAALQPLKYLVVGVDGMQPAKGDTCLYIVRELQTDVTLCAENLDDSTDATIRTRLLQPLKALAQELGLPWYGVVSDAQDTNCVSSAKLSPPDHKIISETEPTWRLSGIMGPHIRWYRRQGDDQGGGRRTDSAGVLSGRAEHP